jgi:hypothetical protein
VVLENRPVFVAKHSIYNLGDGICIASNHHHRGERLATLHLISFDRANTLGKQQ